MYFIYARSHADDTSVGDHAALEVAVGRHLLTSMKSPQITNKRVMIALYHSTAEEKAEQIFLACANT
ncbi:hypothetical protein DPMN_020151 [Dreissena polymorpha]|uniref:Uncharacterized protein n=1 Tax=Dreissena polymorpha TaxID=45954 RepID=A0A9D4SAT0_DREPO|nr:hypothetical protein DPMN_020151 [Dreissena polymorpha]